MHQHNLHFLLQQMAFNLSCIIHMSPSFTKERKIIETKRFPTNVTSKQEMQKSEILRNTPTSLSHISMQIMQMYISDRGSVTSTVHFFNGNIIDWCSNKPSETSRSSSNAETRAMYTGVFQTGYWNTRR